MKNTICLLCFLLRVTLSFSQQFTHADTLRGSNGKGRIGWNVLKYDISVKPDYESRTISGKNIISYYDLGVKLMQIDLQEPMIVDSMVADNRKINFTREGNVYWAEVRDKNVLYKLHPVLRTLTAYFHGKPREAVKAPWDGGWIWTKDKNGNPWMTVACQGLGASVWYPCKDHQSDEPDSTELHITAPSNLVSVGNGAMRSLVDNKDGTTTYSWAVVNPINNYCIIPYIGKYVNFNEVFKGEKGNLNMNFWVHDYNLEKAKKQFTDAPKMMKAFEYWFGPYPFYEDGYKLVEAPYVGMENQSDIAYGNNFENGYAGSGDLSGTGWGLQWDFIIIHESAHEWFGNNITAKDIADMWIHESFANYAETLFTEYYYGKKAAREYVIGIRKKILNDRPIIGKYGVNKTGSADMYYKGGNMLHTIRQIINDDEKFRNLLRGLSKRFYHKTVTTKQIESFINKSSGIDFSKVFDQYLRTTMIPTLEYKIKNGILFYRWQNVVKDFNMPLKIMQSKNKFSFIFPSEHFKQIKFNADTLQTDDNFYIITNKVN